MEKIKNTVCGAFGIIAALTGVKLALLFLSIALVIDFVTGCWASWIEFKRTKSGASVYFIESRKLRASFSKMVTYGSLIMISWGLSTAFFINPIPVAYTGKHPTLVELIIGLCICVECWSMLENMKRAGFDLIGKIKLIIKNIWQLINAAKGGSN